MTERSTTYGPGPETQGGGFRGGPKRWTGRGPAPARHIPWPEIFKHHISVVEGHLKMVDMVRKHTVEGTGNYRTIMGLVERSKEMLSVSKNLAYTFAPPPNQREQVPLGSSSASMYPGYSPADHEYGKAAEEYGKIAAEARQKGISISHPDIEYEIGQAKGVKRKSLNGMRATAGKTEQSGNGSGSASEGPSKKQKINGHSASEPHFTRANHPTTTAPSDPVPEDFNPYFVIDTNPTPVNIPGLATQPQSKRSPTPTAVESKKPKKSKKKHDGALPAGTDFEDIDGEVDAKMKEKEEKRRRKEEKKRKRESAGEKEAVVVLETAAVDAETGKPKKKKQKKGGEEDVAVAGGSTKRGGEEGEGSAKKKNEEGQEEGYEHGGSLGCCDEK